MLVDRSSLSRRRHPKSDVGFHADLERHFQKRCGWHRKEDGGKQTKGV